MPLSEETETLFIYSFIYLQNIWRVCDKRNELGWSFAGSIIWQRIRILY